MPPRYAYWTIIAGGLPTAFRAAEREELLPTFQRIREKHPDAQMKWFARGKLWESQEASRVRPDDGRGRKPFRDARGGESRDRDKHGDAPPADRPRQDDAGPPREKRTRDWRPGGEHRDPRQKFIDQKKQKNAALRQDRWQKKNAPPRERPHGGPPRDDARREPRTDAPRRDWRDRPPADRGAKPFSDRDRKPFADRAAKPFADRDRKPYGKPSGPRGQGSGPGAGPGKRPEERRPQWSKPSGDRPGGDRPRSDRPTSDRPRSGSKPWERKPGGSDRTPGFQGRSSERPHKPPQARTPDRDSRRSETPPPAPRPDKPNTPSGPPPRAHIKSRRPFQPRAGFPKGPRRS